MSFRPSAIRPRSSVSDAFFLIPVWKDSISSGKKRKQALRSEDVTIRSLNTVAA